MHFIFFFQRRKSFYSLFLSLMAASDQKSLIAGRQQYFGGCSTIFLWQMAFGDEQLLPHTKKEPYHLQN